MNTVFRLRMVLLAIIFAFVSSAVNAAEYYVVIGSFAQESNAKRFTATVRHFFKDVTYTYNASRKLYYVTALRTSEKDDARNWALYLKNEKGFEGAWVFTDNTVRANEGGMLIADSGNHSPKTPSVAFYSATAASTMSGTSAASDKAIAHTKEAGAAWTFSNDLGFITNLEDVKSLRKDLSAAPTNLFTFIVEDEKGRAVPSEMMLVNFEKQKIITTFNTGENLAIKSTKREQKVTFVCDRLGYNQETRIFNMDHLSRVRDIYKNEHGVWEVRIRLKRMAVHEIAPMNKTLFYQDAAVLDPTSQAELDELVAIMQSNSGYRVVLHSHCNAGEKREIKVSTDEGNYFDLEATVDKFGSDKLLTKKRADVVKNYLLEHGIDKKRISIVAWGSMEPIVSSTSKEAHVNDRMEIEFVN